MGRTVAQTLLGSLVVLLTVPSGVGPAAGGWLAGRPAGGVGRGIVTSAVAGLLGAVPWGIVVYLAASGTIEPIGYHEGIVHVGVNTAPPALLVFWQEIGLAVLVTVFVIGMTLVGGVLAGLSSGGWRDLSGGVGQ